MTTLLLLPMNRFHREIYDTSMNRALGDAKIMERLTKSHYVENIYSSCGMSQLLELGEGGCITDLVRAARKAGHDTMDPNDKLKILIQIVSAVADLHSFEDDGIVSVTHNDICCHQFVLIDGIYKLNDFHIASMSKKDKSNNVCKQGNNYNSLVRLLFQNACLFLLISLLACRSPAYFSKMV
jgi:serine/threonine protein kinase